VYTRLVRRLDLLVQPGLAPAASLGWDRRLLERARREGRGALRVFTLPGDLLSIGRWHATPRTTGGVVRRWSGGRAAPLGDGFVATTLVLPHRSWLVADEPLALAPEQVLNRCVRGLLEGLSLAGVNAYYPGRDVVTANGRVVAYVAFGVEEGGVTIVESLVAVDRDFTLLPAILDRVDPDGLVPADMPSPDSVTSVATDTGRHPGCDEFAALVCRGYESKLGTQFDRDSAASPPADADTTVWLGERRIRPGLDRHARARIMLGTLEARVRVASDGTIAEAMLSGDFLADVATVARLEASLVGCPADVDEVDRAIARALDTPEAVLLGIRPTRLVAETVVRAAR
jgi:lipoate-protein ligase A